MTPYERFNEKNDDAASVRIIGPRTVKPADPANRVLRCSLHQGVEN
jgi:hypothetical protein